MTYQFNGLSLLQSAVAPLTDDDALRIAALIDRQPKDGSAFVSRWSPHTGVCFTGLVIDGELTGWAMFPAADEASARHAAVEFYVRALQAINTVVTPAWQEATDVINRAAGR